MEDFVHGHVASEDEDAEEADDDGQRHSIKRTYAALALSARIFVTHTFRCSFGPAIEVDVAGRKG